MSEPNCVGIKTTCAEERHVALVALGDDYGNESAGPSFEYETFLPVLARFFDKVTVWPIDRQIRSHGYFRMNAELISWVRQTSPDLLFCVPFENQLDWSLIGTLRNSRTTTMAWMCDDHWRFQRFSRWIAPHFDFIATTDRTAYLRYMSIAGARPLLTQWGYDPMRFRPVAADPIHALSFVGQRRPHREHFISVLRRAGYDVYIRGRGWPSGRASTQELATIPARSLISLNFADSAVPHPHGVTQLKARPFELAGTGTCVVTEYDPQLPSYFEPGRDLLTFHSARQCVRTIAHLVRHPHLARSIGEAGRLRAEKEHTYDIRIQSLLTRLGFVTKHITDGRVCVMN